MIRRAAPRGAPGGGDVTGGGAGRRPVNKARPAGSAAPAGSRVLFYFSVSPPAVAHRVCGSGPRHSPAEAAERRLRRDPGSELLPESDSYNVLEGNKKVSKVPGCVCLERRERDGRVCRAGASWKLQGQAPTVKSALYSQICEVHLILGLDPIILHANPGQGLFSFFLLKCSIYRIQNIPPSF